LSRHETLQFTPRDHAAVNLAAEVFAAWARSEATGRRDRRAVRRGFQDILERSAREALERGRPVAVVVLVVRDAVSLPGSTQRWVAGIRGQLRASDIAGMLAEGEIGLLMHDAGAEQARQIAERLRAVVGSDEGAIMIGTSSRSPGEGPVSGLVQDARADAEAGTGRSEPRNLLTE
jgi:GGDEF domain-containing protein